MWTVGTAKRLATAVHSGQTDKAGAPYIGHPARVAALVEAMHGTEGQVMAAWLHDVVEDSALTSRDLLAMGCPTVTVRLVEEVTMKKGQSRKDYIQSMSEQAWLIKHADTLDNTSPERVSLLPVEVRERLAKKYAQDALWRAEGSRG